MIGRLRDRFPAGVRYMAAAAHVTVRKLGETEDPLVIVFWFAWIDLAAGVTEPAESRRVRLAGAVAVALAAALALAPGPAGDAVPGGGGPAHDVWIRGGRVLDGTGAPARRADLLIRDGEITRVGPVEDARAGTVLDARGLIVAPGFIDGHSHAAEGLADPALSAARPLLARGATTVVVNPDGGGPADLADQRRALGEHGPGVNVVQFVPCGAVRTAVLGEDDRAPTRREAERLERLVAEGTEAGAYSEPAPAAAVS